MLHIYIDGDGCPVKKEIFRVAKRYSLEVSVVVNKKMSVPIEPGIRLVVVQEGFDAADDWIASHAGQDDIVITADIPLAARCLKCGSRVLGTSGREFTEAGIGDALATRALMDMMRQMGNVTGGPAAMDNKTRSRFLSKLDEIINSVRLL